MNHTPVDVPHSELQTVLTIFASPVTHSTRGPSKISRLSLNADTDRYCKLQNVHCKLSLDLKLFRNQFAICTCEFPICNRYRCRVAECITVCPNCRVDRVFDGPPRPSGAYCRPTAPPVGVPADVRFARDAPASHNTSPDKITAIHNSYSSIDRKHERRHCHYCRLTAPPVWSPSRCALRTRRPLFARDASRQNHSDLNSYSSIDRKYERRHRHLLSTDGSARLESHPMCASHETSPFHTTPPHPKQRFTIHTHHSMENTSVAIVTYCRPTAPPVRSPNRCALRTRRPRFTQHALPTQSSDSQFILITR